MREDILDAYQGQIYYDPIESKYDCCEEYHLCTPGDDDDDVSWYGNDLDMNQADDNRILSAWVPSPDVEIDDSWNQQSMEAPDPKAPDNFIAEVHHILFLHFGYTPIIPVPTFHDPVLKTESERHKFMRFLGIGWVDYLNPAFETFQISATATFVDCLTTKGSSISADE